MTNVQTVQEIYAAFGRGDLPAILSKLSDSVVWEYGPTSTSVPWLQRRQGRDGAAAFFATIAAEFEMHSFTTKEFLAGDRVVVALIDIDVTVRRTGRRIVEEDEIHVWRFDEQGLIVGHRHGIDTHLHQLAWAG